MPARSDKERALIASIAAETSWANTLDRSARTATARAALEARFLAEAEGDPVRAEHLRKAYFARLALKSVQARRRNRERPPKAATPHSARPRGESRGSAPEQSPPEAGGPDAA